MSWHIEKTDNGDWFIAAYDWSDFPHYSVHLGNARQWIGNVFTITGTSLMALNIGLSPWAYPLMLVGSAIWFLWALRLKDYPLAAMQGFFCIVNVVREIFRWLT